MSTLYQILSIAGWIWAALALTYLAWRWNRGAGQGQGEAADGEEGGAEAPPREVA